MRSLVPRERNKNSGSSFPHPLGRARGHSRSCLLNPSEPGDAINRHSFFENETIFFLSQDRNYLNLKKSTLTCGYKCLILKKKLKAKAKMGPVCD